MLIDANVLLYAVAQDSPHHPAAAAWIERALRGSRRVGFPWVSLTAFVRIATNARALAQPLTPAEAWSYVDDWLGAELAWIPQPGASHRAVLRRATTELDLRGNLVSDAVLAALCEEHGLAIVSADSDFARFPGLEWINPLTAQG